MDIRKEKTATAVSAAWQCVSSDTKCIPASSIPKNEKKGKKKFETIDGETLMNMPLKPMNFIIDNFLSQGLHLLAGASKVGKSWLALWLSVSVAKGEAVWSMKVKQGTTLYLCLEDSTLRIQNRLFEITDDAPPNVHFTTESHSIGQGIEEQIDDFVNQHPDTTLIIIDTLQMIRPTRSDNTYANDYRDLSVLKKLADKLGIAILLIHHLRKEDDKDTFNRISGTTGIQGAVDSSFTLVENERGSGKAVLSCVGRDIDFRELELKRGKDNVWELLSDSREIQRPKDDRFVSALQRFFSENSKLENTPQEIAEHISLLCGEPITSRQISKRLAEHTEELKAIGIEFLSRATPHKESWWRRERNNVKIGI